MSFVVGVDILKPELVLLATTRMSVTRATQGSDLAQQGDLAIQTRAVTRPMFLQIMETNTSKPWDTSWYNKFNSVFAKKKQLIICLIVIVHIFKRNPSDRDLCPCITLVFTLDQPLAILSTKPTKENLRYQVENSLI